MITDQSEGRPLDDIVTGVFIIAEVDRSLAIINKTFAPPKNIIDEIRSTCIIEVWKTLSTKPSTSRSLDSLRGYIYGICRYTCINQKCRYYKRIKYESEHDEYAEIVAAIQDSRHGESIDHDAMRAIDLRIDLESMPMDQRDREVIRYHLIGLTWDEFAAKSDTEKKIDSYRRECDRALDRFVSRYKKS